MYYLHPDIGDEDRVFYNSNTENIWVYDWNGSQDSSKNIRPHTTLLTLIKKHFEVVEKYNSQL